MQPKRAGFKSHGIREPLTNRIAGILDEYPDGTQIARELLQNSDDARSKIQWYLLDRRNHLNNNNSNGSDRSVDRKLQLFHDDLSEYMGPALLAGNDSLFEEKDFKSMKNLAASEKRTDASKIGQMGIGFNSIYHLTDCPSFISGDQFMVIEPHERIFNGNRSEFTEGAVRGDFVEDQVGQKEFPDQLKAFSVIEDIDFTKPYPGTIFRFPLRTKEQAQTSLLSKYAYPAEKVLDMLMKLKDEALKGLLFLKHIERIVIYEFKDTDDVPVKIFEIEIVNAEEVRKERLQLLRNLQDHVHPDPSASKDDILEYSIRPTFRITQDDESVRKESWQVTGFIGNVLSAREYMTERTDGNLSHHKLIPWVGIAAPLDPGVVVDSSRLFCFLPIGIQLPFPVHINGHFAVKHSRREIWTNQENDFSSQAAANIKSIWNVQLFEKHIPRVYATFLKNMGLDHGASYDLWPTSCGDGIGLESIWKDLLYNLLQIVYHEEQEVFFCGSKDKCDLRMAGSGSVNFAGRDLDAYPLLLEALDKCVDLAVGVPVAILDALAEIIIQEAESNNIGDLILKPSYVRRILRQNKSVWTRDPRNETRIEMLKYCIQDDQVEQLTGLALLPLVGSSWVEFNNEHAHKRFLVTQEVYDVLSEFNDDLVDITVSGLPIEEFTSDGRFTIYWSHMSPAVLAKRIKAIFKEHCFKDGIVPAGCIAQPKGGFPTNEWIDAFWTMAHSLKDDSPALISMLKGIHLLPITGQRLAPLSTISPVIYNDRSLESACIVLDEQLDCWVLRQDAKTMVLMSVAKDYVVGASKAVKVLSILAKRPRDRLRGLPTKHRQTIANYMASCLVSFSDLELDQIQALRSLPIFQTYTDHKYVNLRERKYNSMDWKVANRFSSSEYPWLPPSINLLATKQPMTLQLTGILKTPHMNVSEYWYHVVSNLTEFLEDEWDAIILKFCQSFHTLGSAYDFENINYVPFVRVAGPRDTQAVDTSIAGTRLDPRSVMSPSLSVFFLDQEAVFPAGVYVQSSVISVLPELGMWTTFDAEFVKNRIQALAKFGKDEDNMVHLRGVLTSLYARLNGECSIYFLTEELKNELQTTAWILAKAESSDEMQLCTPSQCRPASDFPLVGTQMPLSTFTFTNDYLLETMGWNSPPPLDSVLAHLLTLIDQPSQSKSKSQPALEDIQFTLIYRFLLEKITDVMALSKIKKKLHSRAWILIDGTLYPADRVALKLHRDLKPHFLQIPHSTTLNALYLAMGVREEVGQEDLQSIISIVGSKYGKDDRLSEEDAELVLKLLGAVADNPSAQWSPDLLVLTENQQLYPIMDAVYDDVNALQDSSDLWGGAHDENLGYTFISSKISRHDAEKLQIPMFSAKCWQDRKESGFKTWAQKEDIVDRIRSVLNDYNPSSIVTEFLQNAADAGATKCVFMLDKRSFGETKVLSKQMAAWQGPALVIYNDAEFSEKDFEALSNLGVGSKREDTSKIGRHGLGFNSVYHFTDVPSVVSGAYIGFFDPQLTNLPKSHTARGIVSEGGQRCDFRKLKGDALSDQLAPYKGLFGCDMVNHFKGTIFRIPLRNVDTSMHTGSSSGLKDQAWTIPAMQSLLKSWTEDAKVSMLFLPGMTTIEIKDGNTLSWSATKRMTRVSDVADHVDISVSDAAPGTMTKSETRKWGVYIETELPLGSSEQIKQISHQNRWSTHRGIAIPLDTKPSPIQGRLFTHLPTPIATGLQFHIHGDFALMSNRKSLAGGSEEGNAMTRWNRFIMVELLPRTLAVAFEHFLRWCFPKHDIEGSMRAKLDLTVQAYFKIWPTTPDKDVEDFIKSFWKQTCNSAVFPCRVNSMGSTELRIVGRKGSETVFPAAVVVPEEVRTRLYRSLQNAGVNICDCPPNIMKRIRATWNVGEVFSYKDIDVDLVRKRIRQDLAFIPSLKSVESKQWILEFVLKPLIDPKLSVEEPLDDLTIIPMKNGKWKPFSASHICYSADDKQRDLIKGDDVLVDETLFSTEALQHILRKLVAINSSGVANMTWAVFAAVFNKEHPNGGTHDEWEKMWIMLEQCSDLRPFDEMLILKDTDGTMRPLKLCRRGLQTTGIKFKDANNVFQLKSLLRDLGVVVFEANQHRNHKYFLNCIAVCDGVHILNAIAREMTTAREIRAITHDEAKVLRSLICESEAAGKLEHGIARCLGRLRIWKSFGPKTGGNFPLIPALGSLYRHCEFKLEGLGVNEDIINEPFSKAVSKVFIKLGARQLQIVSAFQERVLPKFQNGTLMFEGIAKSSYIALLRDAVSVQKYKRVGVLLQQGRIIPARDGSFHTSGELFDPRDELTRTVFSHDRSKFPDQEVWTYISHGVQLFSFRSLRSNLASVLRECAEEVLRQIRTPSYEAPIVRERANSLVRHIYGHVNTTINWMDPHWKIVPSMLAQGLPHSECVPQLSSYLSFSELTMYSNRDLCWTKCAFFPTTLEPTQAFRTKYPNVGCVNLEAMVGHLTTLVRDLAPNWTSMEQQWALKISLFKVYESCDRYAATSTVHMEAASQRLREIPVPFILNGDDKDPTQRELWLWPRQLMLDIDNNIERHQVVHKKLQPYRHFLVAAGVQQMQAVEGTVDVPKGREVGDLEKILVNCFEAQDTHNGFMDVRFKFPRNKEIMAHKFILVHASEYFATRFTGAWATMTTRDAEEPRVEVIDLSQQDEKYEVFWGLIYYLYTDRLIVMNGPPIFDVEGQDETNEGGDPAPETMVNNTTNNKNADDLAERVQYLMELQRVADQYMVPRLKDLIAFEIVVGQKAIHSNVFSVRVHAVRNQSKDVQEYCDKFILENRISIRDYVQGEIAELQKLLQGTEAEAETGAADAIAEKIALKEDIKELETNLKELESMA